MTFSDFTLPEVKRKFGLQGYEKANLFADVTPVPPSTLLTDWLNRNTRLGIAFSNEKARSEFIIAPILSEITERYEDRIKLLSGVELNADPSLGLVGVCDFVFSRSSEQLFLTAPVLAVVEAKRENLLNGLGQCAAEMVAARLVNEREERSIRNIYGAVTTGSLWQFAELEGQTLKIDLTEYGISQLDIILGILSFMVAPES